MAIALVQSAEGNSVAATTNPSFSGATTAGNLVVLAFTSNDYNGTPDTGWTQSTGMEQQTFHGGYLWWRISTGANPPGGYTIGSAVLSSWVLMEFSGVDATPYDVSNGTFTQVFSTSMTTPSIIPTTGNRLLVAAINGISSTGNDGAYSSWLNSFTAIDNIGHTTTADRPCTGTAYRLVTGDGSTGFSSGATYGGGQDARSGLIIAFKEAAGGGTSSGQQIITVGSAINDGTGDPVRVAFTKCNANFTELYTADTTFLTTATAAATYAPLASPTFTGDPQAPTPATTDNDTSIATTAFVKSAVAVANQVFYCDLTDAADVATYKRLLLTPSTHAETSASAVCTGTTTDFLIASFITDPGIPGAIEYPAGSAYRRLYGSVSGGAARFRLQIYTRTTGGVETLGRDEVSNNFTDTTATLQEWLATPSSAGAIAATDRIVVKISARRISGPTNVTVTLYSEGTAHASQIQTTITSGQSAPISATPPLALTGGNLTIDLSAYQPAPQGRLTLQTATPVMTTTQSAKTTIYYTPYVGNLIGLYDGSSFVMTVFAELSVATTDTTKSPAAVGASQVLDWFIWSDGGTLRISHGPAWTSDTARSAGTALVMVQGVLLNNASITNGPAASRGTYVGTTRSNASSQLDWIYGGFGTTPTAGFFGVWNMYNRRCVASIVGDTNNTWTYALAAVRSANAKATHRHSFVCGMEEDVFEASYTVHCTSPAAAAIGICYDVTNAFSGITGFVVAAVSASTSVTGLYARADLGFHFFQAGESATSTTTANFWGGYSNTAVFKGGTKFSGWM